MREITEISPDEGSGAFVIHSYDEDKGWQTVVCRDADELVENARDHLDWIKMDDLSKEDKEAVSESLRRHGIPVPESLLVVSDDTDPNRSTDVICEQIHDDSDNYGNTCILYVTDIHIDSKIERNHGDPPKTEDVESEINESVENIVEDFEAVLARRKILLIGGDVSHDCRRVEMFYRRLTESIPGRNIMAVLGNHEYWDARTRESDPDDIGLTSAFYEEMFDGLYISFADSMLFTYKNGKRHFVRGEELLDADSDEIREFVEDSPLTILGGTGFSGLNEEWNCTCGLYRDAVRTREQEKELSRRFEAVYSKVLEAIPDSKVIVFTHMPMGDWSDKGYNPNWIYVNGHTHRNMLIASGDARVYSDNQIGYGGTVHLKRFFVNPEHDIFRYHADGIHPITRERYKDFYRSKGLYLTCNRAGDYLMLKRGPLYCFMLRMNDRLYLLDGGIIRRTSHNDPEYYFENMAAYETIVRDILEEYRNRLDSISALIRSIGGDGRIHGCIVDVDFVNHVFLNPFDGTITSYTASDIQNKYIHSSFENMLISEGKRDMHDGYRRLEGRDGNVLPAIVSERTDSEGHYYGTEMYTVSNYFYKLQHLIDDSIIRVWNDALLTADKDDRTVELLSILGEETGEE